METTIWDKIFVPILGVNWRVTLSGIISFVSFVALYLMTPSGQSAFVALALPTSVSDFVMAIVRFIAFGTGLLVAFHASSTTALRFGAGHGTSKPLTMRAAMAHNRKTGNGGILILQFVILAGLLFLIAKLSFGF